jgi:hypothetical protein
MDCYIVCEDRPNHSRIHVKICQHRCENAETCDAFQNYITAHATEGGVKGSEVVPLPPEAGISSMVA